MNSNQLDISKLDMRKKEVLDISKAKGITVGQKAQVVLVIDRSGSMSPQYKSGAVQDLVERILPVGMAFDDNEEIDVYIFHDDAIKCTSANISNISGYVNSYINNKDFGGTAYAPIINKIVKDFGGNTGGGSNNNSGGFFKKLLNLGSSNNSNNGSPSAALEYPVYVIFVTDGENSDRAQAIEAITNASRYGIFFQFIGIGNETFSFLKKLDSMNGRFIDNANFFQQPNLSRTSDTQLYNLLMSEFPQWLKEAKPKNLIK